MPLSASAQSLAPKGVVARRSNWLKCLFVKRLSTLCHACTGCLSILPRLNLNVGPGSQFDRRNFKCVIFYKTKTLLIRINPFFECDKHTLHCIVIVLLIYHVGWFHIDLPFGLDPSPGFESGWFRWFVCLRECIYMCLQQCVSFYEFKYWWIWFL